MLASFLIRVGLAIVFLYAAVGAFLDPQSWIGFFPAWLRDIVPGNILLGFHSIFEIFLSLWLLSGKRSYEAGVVSSLFLGLIIVVNLGAFDIVFRDVAIFGMALALTALSERKVRV